MELLWLSSAFLLLYGVLETSPVDFAFQWSFYAECLKMFLFHMWVGDTAVT